MAGAVAVPAGAMPPLRDDLVLVPGPATAGGAPTWTVFDAASDRHFRLGWLEFEVLCRWSLGDPAAIAAAVRRDTTIAATAGDVVQIYEFLWRNCLLRAGTPATTADLVERRRRMKRHPLTWLVHNYLFFRVPLLRPDRLLEAMQPHIGWAFGGAFLTVVGLLAAAGLFLILRQWSEFRDSLAHLATPSGATALAVALMAAKVLHEFGHGLAARRYGCRVPAMGVAFLVLWPVLWTDTTDAWKLRSRRQRLVIDSAGIVVELALAAVASLCWAVLPDGPLRVAAFALAGITWLATLAVNLNPFMRFDGYYLLSDWLDVPNLQDRAFALGRWRLREMLFGFGDPPPEEMGSSRQRLLIAYAWATWAYRLVLFLGIALVVYQFFFKLLGVLLMAVEVVWFILRPFSRELSNWRERRAEMRFNRNAVISLAVLLSLLGLVLVPWQGSVSAPAMLVGAREAVLFAGAAGRLEDVVAEGVRVAAGEPLFVVVSPDLDHRIATTRANLDLLECQIALQSVDFDLAQRATLSWQEHLSEADTLRALERQRGSLVVRAPFDGAVVDLPSYLRPGAWVAAREPLGLFADTGRAQVEAYVEESRLGRIRIGAPASFLADDGRRLDLVVAAIDRTAVAALAEAELASTAGGPIAVRAEPDGRHLPVAALYRVVLAPLTDGPPGQAARGSVAITAERSSLAEQLVRRTLAILIRESGL